MILLINVGHKELGCLQLEDHLLRYLTLFRGIDIEYVLGRLFFSGANSVNIKLALPQAAHQSILYRKNQLCWNSSRDLLKKTLLREIQIEKE